MFLERFFSIPGIVENAEQRTAYKIGAPYGVPAERARVKRG
jgi:hypothetical protein